MSVVKVSNEVLLEGSVGDVSVGVSLENEVTGIGVSTSMFVGLPLGVLLAEIPVIVFDEVK